MTLEPEVLRVAAARHNGRLQTPHAGPGRPALARCPGCGQEMSAGQMGDHRVPCVRMELKKLLAMRIQLLPKDPDPYPDFYIHHLGDNDTEVDFHKASNHDVVTVDLRKIAEMTVNQAEKMAHVRVLGRVVWDGDIKGWRFAPTAAVGRPPKAK